MKINIDLSEILYKQNVKILKLNVNPERETIEYETYPIFNTVEQISLLLPI